MLKSVTTVGGCTLLSRVLGLARDVLMAGFFGTSGAMSSFVLAFTLPNLFRRLFGEGALSSSFIPVFTHDLEHTGRDAAWIFARKVFSLAALVLLALTAGVVLSAHGLLSLAAVPDRLQPVLDLTRIMFPYMLFICLAALFRAALNACGHYAVPAAAPCLLNLVWIAAVVLICPQVGGGPAGQIRVVAWAVVLAGILQWLVQVPSAIERGFRPGFDPDTRDPRVRRVIQLMGPAALGMAVTQFNVVIDRLLAYAVGPQAPAALFFSERLIYFPLGIFATALGSVLLPVFSGHAARADHSRIASETGDGLRRMFYLMLPAAAGLGVLAVPVVRMLFEWRIFDGQSTQLTAIALRCYAPGLLVFSAAKVLIPAFYARQDTRTPVRVGAAAMVLNLVLSVTLILALPRPYKHGGIALATVLAEAAHAAALMRILQRETAPLNWKVLRFSALRAAAGTAALVPAALLLHRVLRGMGGALPVKAAQIGAVLGAVAGGAVIYFALTAALGSPEPREFRRALGGGKSKR
ncbi:putative peptidoglycan biosynthesis protein MurJ [Kiritimatiella glycovorans]|uniref:Probable lipid II flippase MurJ n=2 Tax=Kiritimatiella glycovorans TaxID=1307763 RepID=A0A0G3EFA9_9BACT|nr:putative peptidoglycan biosynthesis protein MurJ [Kiritimatiella glycovorans]